VLRNYEAAAAEEESMPRVPIMAPLPPPLAIALLTFILGESSSESWLLPLPQGLIILYYYYYYDYCDYYDCYDCYYCTG
jgi:hypothetical protein